VNLTQFLLTGVPMASPRPRPTRPSGWGRCRKVFSGLGRAHRCIRPKGHDGEHVDQHENQWDA